MSVPRVPAGAPPVIEIDSVVTRFGSQVVHNGVSLTIRRGELVALIEYDAEANEWQPRKVFFS